MARRLTANVANQFSFGVGGLRAKLEGASAITFHAHINIASVVGATQNDNPIVMVLFAGTGVAFSLNINALTGGAPKLGINGRSTSGDTRAAVTGATTLPLSTWIRVGGYFDFPADRARVYLNGAPDVAATAVVFAASVFTYTSAPTGADALGAWLPGTAANYSNIDIAEAAFWTRKLSDREFLTLGKGYAPIKIRNGLVNYWPLLGNTSPEPNNVRGGPNGTITGSVPKVRHPMVIR